MIIGEKEVFLKNGQKVLLRSPLVDDAQALHEHKYKTSEESYFLARYPEEIQFNDRLKDIIRNTNESERDFFLSAFVDGQLIGDAGVNTIRNHIKFCHRAYFGISIQEAYCDLGLGSIILQEVIELAKESGFEQLELGVFADNSRAIHVYEKMGFQKVGVQPRAYKLKDGSYRDEVQMVLLLKELE